MESIVVSQPVVVFDARIEDLPTSPGPKSPTSSEANNADAVRADRFFASCWTRAKKN